MALTKIKLNTGFVSGSLPDANIPNDITISGAQTGITSVGTLSSLTTSGSTGSNYIGSFTNTSATGWGLFVKGGADNADYALRVQDKDAGDLLSVKAGGHIGLGTNDPANFVEILAGDGVGDDIFALRVQNQETTDGRSYGLKVMAGSNSSDTTFELNDHDGTNVLMKVLGNGNVSIGSADPLGYGLNIESSNALRIKGADSSSNYHIRALDSASNVDFVVRGDGRVGIGTASPGYLTELRVNDTTVDTPRFVIRQLGTGDSSLAFQMPDSPYGFTMGVDNSDSDRFKISTGVGDVGGSGEKMSIDPNGMITFTNSSARFNFYANSTTDIVQYFGGHDTDGDIRIAGSVACATTAGSNACDGELIFATASGNTNSERMRITSNGDITRGSNDFTSRVYSGYTNGNSGFSVTFPIQDNSSLLITAIFTHYGAGIATYGCARMAWLSCRDNSQDPQDISNITSSNGGSWSISTSSSTVTVSKVAGSYSGGGHYWVKIEGSANI